MAQHICTFISLSWLSWETSKGRQGQSLPSSLGTLDASSKVTFPLLQTEARQHKCCQDVTSDVRLSCSSCPWAGADQHVIRRLSYITFVDAIFSVLCIDHPLEAALFDCLAIRSGIAEVKAHHPDIYATKVQNTDVASPTWRLTLSECLMMGVPWA